MSALKEILGESVIGKDGKKINVDTLQDGNKIIGLYFSAHWCPPCRGFTPVLVEFYEKHKEQFQVVFISSDRDQSAFDEYFEDMPWLAVPFNDRDRKEELCDKYGIRGIPTLLLLTPDGTLVEDGRSKVQGDPDSFPWGLL